MAFHTFLPDDGAPVDLAHRVFPRWAHPDEHEIPAAVSLVRPLASAPGASLRLQRADAYSDGIAFVFRLDLVRSPTPHPHENDSPKGFSHFGPEPLDPHDEFHVGFAFADGTSVSSDGLGAQDRTTSPTSPTVTRLGGSGGGDQTRWISETSMWLWPLPPAGPATLHFSFFREGLGAGSLELDTRPLLLAATAAQVVRLG